MTHTKILQKGQLLSLYGNALVTVFSGEAWVTLENDEKDYVLGAEQKIHQTRQGLMVIEALEHSVLFYTYSLQEPEDSMEATHDGNLSAALLTVDSTTLAGAAAARGSGDQEQF